jgi:hypothetical protein
MTPPPPDEAELAVLPVIKEDVIVTAGTLVLEAT